MSLIRFCQANSVTGCFEHKSRPIFAKMTQNFPQKYMTSNFIDSNFKKFHSNNFLKLIKSKATVTLTTAKM